MPSHSLTEALSSAASRFSPAYSSPFLTDPRLHNPPPPHPPTPTSLLFSPLLAAYASSKAALNALTDCMRMEMKPFGINVVLVAPGIILTPMPGCVLVMPPCSLLLLLLLLPRR